ncbi:copper chaperone PCu(A)C [Uruburuella testudinis]|uniref:Copper chaperone PCu(A)C n=1 Tax=Uruburuella testudinis TaxID=1282863 RepID=A0ABY4DPZ7_9NEIS|nr:copper chaperone PCu(A)C [Uruburuella testudinis]UOO80951.1 copper chaperone PCu(A)C [Uruburuella testudinis]
MKKLMAALLLAGTCQAAFAAGIDVDDAWARTTVQGMNMGGVFMALENDGKTDDVLLGGSTPVAERVEIHTHINDNGVMRMREVEGGLPLPKGREVVLKPGSYHIMLMGLKAPLQEGQKFPLTLKFKNAKAQTVTVETKTPAQSQAPAHHHHQH